MIVNLIFLCDNFAIEEKSKAFLEDLKFDNKTGQTIYTLAKPAYVRIRAGIKFGPLQKTIVNWEKREAGSNIEFYDGFDLSGKFKISDSPDFVFTTHYFPTEGEEFILGQDLSYSSDAFIGRVSQRVNFNRIHQQHNREICYDPQAEIKFLRPEQGIIEDGFYCLKDKITPLVIDLDSKDKGWFNKDHFSIYIFIDNIFLHGQSDGYLPYNWNFDASRLPEGKHQITVNLRSLKDHIATASLPIIVKH